MDTPGEKKLWKQVAELGFIGQSEDGIYKIYANPSTRSWYLQQQEDDRWVLYVGKTPQIVFQSGEMIKFLQHQKAQPIQAPPKT